MQTKRQQRRSREKLAKQLPPPRATLVPLSNPVAGFDNVQRAELAALARQRRGARKFPKNYRDLVFATIVGCGQRGHAALAAAFGVRVTTFKEWVRDIPELAQAISEADANLRAIIITPLYQAARAGDLDAARWFAEKNWPEDFGAKAAPNQVNVQVNTGPPVVPPTLSADEYLRLLPALNAPAALPTPQPSAAQPVPAEPVEASRDS